LQVVFAIILIRTRKTNKKDVREYMEQLTTSLFFVGCIKTTNFDKNLF